MIETALDHGYEVVAYLHKGELTFSEMREAIKKYDGTDITPDYDMCYINAGLECWHGCGYYHKRTTRGDGHLKHCDGDEESWVWNFKTGPYIYTLIPANGKTCAQFLNE